ncbi:MAG: beta-lactamase family protein [Pyrinomonadaceae bacterium]|nr:beta-lactamase family protein [Pyrinomonadaceae bacterium]
MRKLMPLMMLGLILFSSVWGQVPNLPTTPNREGNAQLTADKTPSGVHELTALDVEAFLDGIVPLQLERDDIAGATVAIVKDGKLLFAKGYGYSDYEKKKTVSADETLFRPGSVSKLFTWTAMMQLAEQGKLDLDRNVNDYLDFKIPDAFGQPVTLKNLLTHTPGFEEQIKDLFTIGSESPNLGGYLKTHIPRRIYPPGTVPAYSNYGAALAGYIVELVSGRPFHEYVEENIFKPLGMIHSTFRQPLPPALAPFMSNGYQLASDEPKPFEVVVPFPAGSMSSTAADMSRFMLAHLQDGQFGDARILRPETARLMHSRLFALDQAANAMAYGFYEESRNGHRIIGHAGDTLYFHSDLHLIPDAGVGFFVSHNSLGSGNPLPRTTLWEMFLDRYFPYTAPATPTLDSAKEDATAVSGSYILSRRSETSFLKAATLIGEFTVSPVGDGMIEVAQLTGPNGKPKRWREVAPMTFLETNGRDKLIFKPDQNGRMQVILPYPFFVGQRVGLFENNKILLPVIGISLLIMLLTLVLWPLAWFVRRHHGHKLELTPIERRLRLAVRIVFALVLFFMAAMTGLVVYASTHIWFLSDRGNTWFHLAQVIGVLGAIGTLVVFYNAIQSWRNQEKRIWSKLQATLFVLVCFGFLWFAFAGNLLRFSSNY